MAKMSVKMCVVVFLVALLTMTVLEVEALTCGQVIGAVAPCLGYLRNGGDPPAVCCNGLTVMLKTQVKTRADRRAICNCLKSGSSSYRGVNGDYAASLPGKCRFNFPYKISPSTECNRIQ